MELLQQNVDWAFVFDCNRLTGNNLSYKETLQIISQNKTIAGKSFDEHLEAVNLNQTLLWIRQAANDKLIFNKKLLIDAHIILYNSSANKEAGKYRTQNSTQSSPPAFLVEKLVDDFFESMVIQQNNMHPLLLATQVFERIMSISPFAMGNEQMAQLMMNLLLNLI